MTALLEHAVEALRALPPEAQDAVARLLLPLARDHQAVISLTAEEEADFAAADEEIARGEFATDDEMDLIWTKPRG